MSANDEASPPVAPQDAETEPQVFAVSHTGGDMQLTRRQFVQLAALVGSASALSGCAAPESSAPSVTSAPVKEETATVVPASDTPDPAEAPSSTNPPPTSTRTPKPPTKTPSLTPTELPQCVVKAASINLRSGPGVAYTIIGALKKGAVLNVVARNRDGTWLNVETETGQTGWVALSVIENLSIEVADLPLAQNVPTPAATARPAQPAGQPTSAEAPAPPGSLDPPAGEGDRITIQVNGETRYLPCGSPIPAGYVCTCNCVPGCSCVGHQDCACDQVCSCDRVCTCESVGHYWHPN